MIAGQIWKRLTGFLESAAKRDNKNTPACSGGCPNQKDDQAFSAGTLGRIENAVDGGGIFSAQSDVGCQSAAPAWQNPQAGVLEEAERLLDDISSFLGATTCTLSIRNSVENCRERLSRLSSWLSSPEHRVAFIGAIGVGKSTAISYLFSLLFKRTIKKKKKKNGILANIFKEKDEYEYSTKIETVLETGSGGTTVCEVEIRDSDKYGIMIEPYSDSEIIDFVSDFCHSLWMKKKGLGAVSAGVSREIDRGIRNMAGVARKKDYDPALELAENSCAREREFVSSFLERMNMGERTRTEIFSEARTPQEGLKWLSEQFLKVNNGRMPGMSLPKRMILLVPGFGKEFGEGVCGISVVDSKGIDDVLDRRDIDSLLRDERAIIVFCCAFNDVSGKPTRDMIRHFRNELGEDPESGRLSIMALDRNGDALQVKDDDGRLVQDAAEGCKIKLDQLRDAIRVDIPVYFYNALGGGDSGRDIRQGFVGQIAAIRKARAAELENAILEARQAMALAGDEAYNRQVKFILEELDFFLKNNEPKDYSANVVEKLRETFDKAYASTIWASTRRRGVYENFDFYHAMSNRALSKSAEIFPAWFSILDEKLKSFEENDLLYKTGEYVASIRAFVTGLKQKFYDSSLYGVENFCMDQMKNSKLWDNCVAEWGQGSGYKKRVWQHIENWFERHPGFQDGVTDVLRQSWNDSVIDKITQSVILGVFEDIENNDNEDDCYDSEDGVEIEKDCFRRYIFDDLDDFDDIPQGVLEEISSAATRVKNARRGALPETC